MPFLATDYIPLPTTDLLSWIFDKPLYDEDTPIFIDAANPLRSISCRQARAVVKRLAAGFRQAGLNRGDCVCMHAFNDIYYPIVCLGIVAAGGIFAGTNPSYTAFELQHAMRTAEIKFWVVEPQLLPKVQSAASACGMSDSNIFAFDVLGQEVPIGVRSWTKLQMHGEADWERFDDIERAKTAVGRLFSSGTTGLPKALNISHHNLTSQHTLVMEHESRPYVVARAHTSALKGGYMTVIMRRFDLEPWLVNIEKFQITEVQLVPAMVISILQSGLLEKYSLKSLCYALTGSAPLDKSIQHRFKAYMPADAPFNQGWGMTETSCVGMYIYPPEQDFTGAVGRPMPNCDVKLVDDEGKDITGYDVRGELCMRGPIMINDYFNDDEANRTGWDEEGYFHTGDIAYCVEDTKLWHIVDRKKELIKVRGFQVAPAEIEGVLFNHPNIVDAAVIGIQYSIEESELPRAYIVARPGITLTVEEVREYAAKRLARYKNLDGGIKFVDAIPRNASGKVLKYALRAQAEREIGARL